MKIQIDEKRIEEHLGVKRPWFIQTVMLDMEAKELVIKLGCDRIR